MHHDLEDTARAPEISGGPESEPPGLPWFRTWRGVYVFVLASFVFYVILFAAFSRVFS